MTKDNGLEAPKEDEELAGIDFDAIKKRYEDALCDACLFKQDQNPDIPLSELCDRCIEKQIALYRETLEEVYGEDRKD